MLLIYAFSGFFAGVILNFMPCILPILGIKMLSLSKLQKARDIKETALFTVLGILVFMLLLSLTFVFGKEFWGFQMQNRAFMVSFAFILFVFTGILINFITLYTPKFVRVFSDVNLNSNFFKSFFSGFLIVIFSASCTGPVIAIAVAFGMQSQDWYVMPIVCFFMGLGLSLPYFLMVISPATILKITKNKKFSRVVKVASIFMMLATISFVLYIIFKQNGWINFTIFLAIILIFIALLKFFKSIVVILVGICVICIASFGLKKYPVTLILIGAEVFDEGKIDGYLKEGRPVLIRFEASWCLTCLANDAFTLKGDHLKNLLKSYNAVYMKGDLTNGDENLEKFMQKFNSYGLPFNAVYTNKVPEGKLLPLLLSLNDLKLELNDE